MVDETLQQFSRAVSSARSTALVKGADRRVLSLGAGQLNCKAVLVLSHEVKWAVG